MIEGGKLLALWHPAEFLIIIGAAFGAFLTSNPVKVVKASLAGIVALRGGTLLWSLASALGTFTVTTMLLSL